MLTKEMSQTHRHIHKKNNDKKNKSTIISSTAPPRCLSQWQKTDFKGKIDFIPTVCISNMFFSLRTILNSGINQSALIITISKALIYAASENEGDDEGVEDEKHMPHSLYQTSTSASYRCLLG